MFIYICMHVYIKFCLCLPFHTSYFVLARVLRLRTRTTVRVAELEGIKEISSGQLMFCLLERRRAKPERSPSSSSDVQGGAPLTAPRDDVACINS